MMRSSERSGALVVAIVLGLGAATPMVAQSPALISTADLARRLPRDTDAGAIADYLPVVTIDVRQSWISYLQNHIPGAVWLNVETLRAQDGELPFQLLPAVAVRRVVPPPSGQAGA